MDKKRPKKSIMNKKRSRNVRFHSFMNKLKDLRSEYLGRRPHRSFTRTRRRDYVRSLELPGYIRFTGEVVAVLRRNARVFAGIIIIFLLLNTFFVGLSSQQSFLEINELLAETGSGIIDGDLSEVGQSGLLALVGVAGVFSPQLTDIQQVYAGLFALLLWLATVWILRETLRGQRPTIADAMYNSGAPIVSTGIVVVALIIQFIPLALAVIGINVASQSGLLETGLLSMVSWLAAGTLALISIYWATSTVMALVVVTLPGMRPLTAIRTAGDLVIGRRSRILARLVWLVGLLFVAALVIIVPTIVFSRWLITAIPALDWLPIVPSAITILTSIGAVFAASYVYMLYRKVVDDDASPA